MINEQRGFLALGDSLFSPDLGVIALPCFASSAFYATFIKATEGAGHTNE